MTNGSYLFKCNLILIIKLHGCYYVLSLLFVKHDLKIRHKSMIVSCELHSKYIFTYRALCLTLDKEYVMRMFYILLAMMLVSISSFATETTAVKISRAESAAHPAITREATIMDVDGTMLRKGSNGWVCMPGLWAGDEHPHCNDAVFSSLMAAIGKKADFKTDRIGISYMLQGDALVSNTNPYATDVNNGDVWVQEGPHMMLVLPKDQLVGLSDDPFNGGPYVMWKDTPYAHIMVPVKP